jgi:hypothetical protein
VSACASAIVAAEPCMESGVGGWEALDLLTRLASMHGGEVGCFFCMRCCRGGRNCLSACERPSPLLCMESGVRVLVGGLLLLLEKLLLPWLNCERRRRCCA